MLLKDKNILITGASKGIGRSTAIEAAKQGASLFLLSRNREELESLKKEIVDRYNVSVNIFKADITILDDIKAVFELLNKEKIYIDALVNNAGIMSDSSFLIQSEVELKRLFETNVFGTILTTQVALKSLIKRKGGSIIFLSSVIGTKGSPGQSAYSATKSSVIGLTKSLSKELAPLSIRVNAIAPGFIATDLTQGYNEQQTEKIMASVGMRRAGSPEDVARVILFLCSEWSSYVTGQVIEVDGGMII